MLQGDQLIILNGKQIDSFDAFDVHKTSAEVFVTVLRDGQEVCLSTTKPSAEAPLGISVKKGVDISGITALSEGLKGNTTLQSLK